MGHDVSGLEEAADEPFSGHKLRIVHFFGFPKKASCGQPRLDTPSLPHDGQTVEVVLAVSFTGRHSAGS